MNKTPDEKEQDSIDALFNPAGVVVGIIRITKDPKGYTLTVNEGPKQGEAMGVSGVRATELEALLLTFYDRHF